MTPTPKHVLGLATIGQAPRADVRPDIEPLLGDVRLVEHGALDELDASSLAGLRPEDGDDVLVSRLRDGSEVVMAHHKVQPLLAAAVRRCERDGASATLVMCTGHFDPMAGTTQPVLAAERLFQSGVVALTAAEPVGVVSPLPEQVDAARDRWSKLLGRPVQVAAASPYTGAEAAVGEAARQLSGTGAQWIVLDCIGYTEAMRAAATEATGRPSLLARSVAVRLALEALA